MFKTKQIIPVLLAVIFFVSCTHQNQHSKTEFKLISPNKSYEFTLSTKGDLTYLLNKNNTLVTDTSNLGFLLEDGKTFPENVTIEKVEIESVDTTWEPVYGEHSSYADKYNEALVWFKSDLIEGKCALRVRLYNEGLAFRYEIKNAPKLAIKNELTTFSFPTEPQVWVSKKAQGYISEVSLSEVKNIVERPLLAEVSDSLFVAIGEAGLVDFARMKFKLGSNKKNTLQADLYQEKDKMVIAKANDFISPWRFIMAGKTPSELLQNNFLLLNLNKENKIANTDYIKPGKVLREVTLTTEGGIACIDFAAQHNIQFIEFDAGWYGNEYSDESDATTVTVDPRRSPGPLDLQHVINYGKEQGIGIILYVNRKAIEKQLDEILPLFQEWGVAGVKYGFVRTGSQDATSWIHEAVRKAAKYDLMVDIHDEYRPTGYSRTYPNLMTQEGIRGDEESPCNDMVIKTLFTRMIAGAGDQTNCYFAERVSQKMGSHASQMAKAICIYSPWQFIYWYDRPLGSPGKKGGAGDAFTRIEEIEDLAFYDALPTVWDETKILEGYPGKYAAIARKKGDKWFLGALAGTDIYNSDLKLTFLDEGKKYKAIIYSDDASLNTLAKVRIKETVVTSLSILDHTILPQNGLAVIFTPLNQ